MDTLLTLLANDGFICVNKRLIKKIGLNGAVLLGELISQYNYWSKTNQVDTDGYFYLTSETCERNTGLSYYEQSKELNKFKEKELILSKNKGIPAKRYFKLCEKNLIKLLSENSETIIQENDKQELKNLDSTNEKFKTNNNINIIIENNNLDDKSSKEIDNFLTTTKNTSIYKASDNDKNKKEINLDNSRTYKNLVEFISNLKYNQSTIDNLLLWYNNVGKGRVSIKQLKDKIIKLHSANLSENQISESFYNAYMNGWFAFYVPNKLKSSNTNISAVSIDTVTETDYKRNEDGSLKVY